jgi:ketosteroid isomerase-like protein
VIKGEKEGGIMINKLLRFMIIVGAAGFAIALATPCPAQNTGDPKKQEAAPSNGDILMRVDREFNALAADSGLAVAFSYFAADSAVILQRGSSPIVGREAIRAAHADEKGPSPLHWEPYFADLAASLDIGYTLGNYRYVYNDSTGSEKISYGYYVTIWKKQSDDTWKYVLDTGVSAPPPEKAQSGGQH